MSGGGGGSKKKAATPASTTKVPYGSTPSMPSGRMPQPMTIDPHLPGGIGMIANQLNAGFGSGGGSGPMMKSFLDSMYKPVKFMNFLEPISTTAAGFDAAKHTVPNTGNPILDLLLQKKPLPGTKKK